MNPSISHVTVKFDVMRTCLACDALIAHLASISLANAASWSRAPHWSYVEDLYTGSDWRSDSTSKGIVKQQQDADSRFGREYEHNRVSFGYPLSRNPKDLIPSSLTAVLAIHGYHQSIAAADIA